MLEDTNGLFPALVFAAIVLLIVIEIRVVLKQRPRQDSDR